MALNLVCVPCFGTVNPNPMIRLVIVTNCLYILLISFLHVCVLFFSTFFRVFFELCLFFSTELLYMNELGARASPGIWLGRVKTQNVCVVL